MSYNSKYKSSKIEEILDSVGGKQDAINDLSAIREGASKGATSVQPEDISKFLTIEDVAAVAKTGNYNDLTDKPTIPSAVTESTVSGWGFTKNAGTITGVSANGTSVATSGVANIPAASTSKYGVTKLSSATDSTSTSLAATASAVKAAYDLADGKVGESDIFENKNAGIIKAEALYNDKSQGGLIYALPTSRLVEDDEYDDILTSHSQIFYGNAQNQIHKVEGFHDENSQGLIYALPNTRLADSGDYDEIIATEGYVNSAVANAGGAYNLTSLTKAQLDSFTSGSTITINADDVSAIRANKIITITSNSGRCLMTAWSAQSSSVVQLTFLCDNVVYIAKASLQSNGTAKINEVAKHLVDANSGGGSSSSGNGAYSEANHGTSDTTFTLTPNTFHIWDEVANLTLTLGSETSGVANEFLFQFTSGATATSLALPDDIKWANGETPIIDANKIYQVSILKGLASVLEFVKNIFFIDNTTYYYKIGMTWEEWVNSSFNTNNYSIYGDSIVNETQTYMVGNVVKTDLISLHYHYNLTTSSLGPA